MIDFGEHQPEKKFLDMTPMLDVVFLLLIFFMLTSIFSKPSIPLNLPESESAKVAREPDVSVAIKLDGTVFLNSRAVALAELQPALAQLYEGKERREISLVSDKGVPFGRVVEVMDLAKKAGAEDISVIADKKK
ncbi:MAG: ExbD/TolR family protein [Desulfuromonadaceae bacterium]